MGIGVEVSRTIPSMPHSPSQVCEVFTSLSCCTSRSCLDCNISLLTGQFDASSEVEVDELRTVGHYESEPLVIHIAAVCQV